MKISVVVPVYNVENYISKCVSTLLNQGYDDYEIIIVDDGSKDRSIEIVKNTFKDSRIKIIRQENKGLSGARNTGLRAASGDYVWFVDSDDWIEENCLPEIVKLLNDIDVLYYNSFYVEWNNSQKRVTRGNNVESGRQLSMIDYYEPVQFYIYRRMFLLDNNLLFKEGVYHEDVLFTPCSLYVAGKIDHYDEPVYHLLRRGDSISQKVNPKRCYDLIQIINILIGFCNNRIAKQDRGEWSYCISNQINNLLFQTQLCDVKTKKDVKKFFSSERGLVSYYKNSPKLLSKLLGTFSYITHLNLYNLYSVFYKIRYLNYSPEY